MTENNIILPVIVHMLLAILLIFCWKRSLAQRIISVTGNVLIVGLSIWLFSKVWNNGILTMQAGNWQAPFGISFVADVFSSTMILLTSIAGLAVSIFSTVGINRARVEFGYFPIFHFLLMGLNGAFLTGDIFNLFVWFEIILISSFVLLTLGGRKPQIGGAIKYVTLNLLASVIFLTAIAILYGLTGSLNMADLSIKVTQVQNKGLISITALLFFVAFGIKSAVFPLYFWLPASYHTPPSAIAAIFGGLLTKVGIYALFRVFTLIFIPDTFMLNLLSVIATATLLTGAFGAVLKKDFRNIFSYLIVCHIGYMIAGLGMFTKAALTGAIFYLIHDIIAKTNIFLVSGLVYKIKGTVRLKELGGLYAEYPKISLLIALAFFSLVGIPPLSGFWPKIYLYEASFNTSSFAILTGIIIASFVTLFVIARLWSEAFWKNDPAIRSENQMDGFQIEKRAIRMIFVLPIILLVTVSLYIGFAAEHIVTVSNHIVDEMLNTSPYIKAVLGIEMQRP
jgi:multicomponent Na+:H+ antiporter subunit D